MDPCKIASSVSFTLGATETRSVGASFTAGN